MSGWTPGPWRYQAEIEGGRTSFHVYTESGKWACPAICPSHGVSSITEREANARLISLATEMADALEEVVGVLNGCAAIADLVGALEASKDINAHSEAIRALLSRLPANTEPRGDGG